MTQVMTDSAALATLADIEFPAPPEWRQLFLLMACVLVLIAAFAGLWFVWRRFRGPDRAQPTDDRMPAGAQALVHLLALQQAWESGTIDDREAGFRMCALLRLGLELPQLRAETRPNLAESRQWLGFVDELRQIRYRPDRSLLKPAHFEQARGWLSGISVNRYLARV